MLFTQLVFLVFFLVTFVAYWAIPNVRGRITLLTLASFFFYGVWDYRFLLLIWGVIAVAYSAQLLLFRSDTEKAKNLVVGLSVGSLLGLLAIFKYLNFFIDSFVVLAGSLGLELSHPTLYIILPVGISFYIFQAIGFVVDVRKGVFKQAESLLNVSFFVSFFPQLVAGPIVRADEFFPQIPVLHKLRDLPVNGIVILFLGGFIKKALIADNIAIMYVDPVFAEPALHTSSAILIGVFAYAVQIYCDFSGYSDMAIATSRAFGFRLPVNFRAPYLSVSITEFWRRWHISLSNWLRDYLYISLGGNRGGPSKTYRNLMATMVLGGLWHGASFNFLIWGYLHGAALAIERLFNWPKIIKTHRYLFPVGLFITFYFTCICWVFFRSVNFDVSLFIVGTMFGLPSPGTISFGFEALAGIIGLGLLHAVVFQSRLGERLARLPIPAVMAICAVIVACVLPLLPNDSQPFIYFQF